MLRLHTVLKSSRAAIDLASIMVGIIIIGLIGGVIAATVFAVIPWAQDNAAKQQLDSVASAESAYRGLSTSKDANLQDASTSPTNASDPNQVVLNSTFTGSAGLTKNNLLSLNKSGLYCVIATTDGKDYHAYSKSGSGKWFYITSGKTQPSEYTGTAPCVNENDIPVGSSNQIPGTVDAGVDNGSGVVPVTPATPLLPKMVYDFETSETSGTWGDSSRGSISTTYARSGTHSGKVTAPNVSGSIQSLRYVFPSETGTLTKGKTYKMSAWIYQTTNYNVAIATSIGVTNRATETGKWTQVSTTFTASNNDSVVMVYASVAQANFYIDDLVIEQV